MDLLSRRSSPQSTPHSRKQCSSFSKFISKKSPFFSWNVSACSKCVASNISMQSSNEFRALCVPLVGWPRVALSLLRNATNNVDMYLAQKSLVSTKHYLYVLDPALCHAHSLSRQRSGSL